QISSGGGSFQSVSFIDINTGWSLILEDYRVFKTTNSGNNWGLLATLPDCFNAHCITFKNTNIGWVSGDCGQIFKTVNGGLNWFQQISGTTNFLQSIFFLNDSIGWSVGGGGIIIHTMNGGIVSINKIENEIPNQFKLVQNYPNPFNPVTKIKYHISKYSHVKILISDLIVNQVEFLINQIMLPGVY